jgi:hypothetical protein
VKIGVEKKVKIVKHTGDAKVHVKGCQDPGSLSGKSHLSQAVYLIGLANNLHRAM